MASVTASPPLVLGRYALYGVIASGGMASVHYGRVHGAAGFSRTVAIKRLHRQFTGNPQFVSMFVDEARLAARIRHPNVVPTLDVVAEQDELFLVMEYVHGESLSRLIETVRKEGRHIPPRVVGAILSGVLHGLHAAHEARGESGDPLGIVHRDVSPQNVLVGVDGVARVLDFGIAKASARLHQTRDDVLKGKISYMAPEQARRGDVGPRTDVYAAGAVLWEALTSEVLFDGPNEAVVLEQVLVGLVDPPGARAPEVSPELDAIVLRALDSDPGKRFASAREMAVAIERALPLALPSEVGEWIQGPAKDALALRASRVAEIERGQAEGARPVDVDAAAPVAIQQIGTEVLRPGVARSTPPTADRRRRAFLFVVALATVAAMAVLAVRSRHARAPASAASAPVDVVAPRPSSGADDATSTAAVPATGAPPAPVATSRKAPSISAQAAPKHAKAPGAAPPPDCDPPFVRDDQGHKVWKRECL